MRQNGGAQNGGAQNGGADSDTLGWKGGLAVVAALGVLLAFSFFMSALAWRFGQFAWGVLF